MVGKYDKREKRLSAQQVARLIEPGKYADGGGLYLQVDGKTSRRWFFHYSLNRKRREMPLGSVRDVSLAEAREKLRTARKLWAAGIDPLDQRRADEAAEAAAKALRDAKLMTFKTCAERFIESREGGWKNAKHAAQWTSTLDTYAYPVLGDLSVCDIDTGLVLKVIEPHWQTKTETMNRVRGRIEAVLNWAKTRGYRDGDNPARWRGHLENVLDKRARVASVKHHAAVPDKEIPAFMGDLRARESISARALEWTILTAARTGETIGAEWSEVDTKAKVWTIPAERMKAGKEHRVPLSDRALQIFKGLPRVGKYMFAGAKEGRPISNMAMLQLLRGMKGEGVTVHGFRSSFMDWGHDRTGYTKELMDIALAHTVSDKVEAAYRRSDMFEKRLRLMQSWADYCASKPVSADVVPIRA